MSAQDQQAEDRPGEEGLAGQAVCVLTIPGAQHEIGVELLTIAARVLAWVEPTPHAEWDQLFDALVSSQDGTADRAWTVQVRDEDGFWPEVQREVSPLLAQSVAFDLSLDCNAFRTASPQPFSRSSRGRVLDALMIDNARRARLSGVYADHDDTGVLTLVLFTESRAQQPGRWRAQPIARAQRAANRGDPEPPHPLEIDFGEQWEGVLYSLADLVLGLDPASEAISTRERLEAWGGRRVGAVRSIVTGFEGRVWVWSALSSPENIVVGLPLARGASARGIAGNLRTIFGQRLVWGRDEVGRATATLALIRENRPPAAGDRTLSMRFVTIVDRTTLTIVMEAGDLDDAVETLADIPQ